MNIELKRWLFRRIFNEEQRKVISNTIGIAIINHKKNDKWTPKGFNNVLNIEKITIYKDKISITR